MSEQLAPRQAERDRTQAVQALKGEHEPWDEPMTALRKTFGW